MNRSKFLPSLILGLVSMAQAIIVSVDIGGAPGVEYVSIGEHGAVQVFSSARVLSTSMKKVHQGNLPLGAGERILGTPMVWRGATAEGFLVAAAVRGTSDAVRVWSVPADDRTTPFQVAASDAGGAIQDALPLVTVADSRELLVRLPAAWKRIALTTTQANPYPILPATLATVGGPNWSTSTVVAYLMAVDGSFVDVAWADGTVSRCALADGGTCSSPVQILGTTEPVMRTPVARPWREANANSSDWYAIDAKGDLWKTVSSGTPVHLSQAPRLADAVAVTSVFQRVQVLTSSGAMHELSAANGAPIHRTAWHMRSGDLVVDAQGNPAAPTGQIGGSPSAFGTVLQGGHTLWGYFHHLGAFNIAQYVIEPRTAKASTSDATKPDPSSVLIRYAVAGNENAFLRIIAEPTKATSSVADEVVSVRIANALTPRTTAWTMPRADEDYKVHLQVCSNASDFQVGVVGVPSTCLDSVLTVRVDRTLPVVATDWVSPQDGKPWPTAEVSGGCASLDDFLTFDVGNLPDAAPFADRNLDVSLELRSKSGGANWTLSPEKVGATKILTLDKFFQGVRIPTGQYDLQWRFEDSVGNVGFVAPPPGCVEIKQFDFPFALSASPQLVKSSGAGEVILQVTGSYDYPEDAVVKVSLDDAAASIWEFQIDAQAPEKSFVLRKSFKIADLVANGAIDPANVQGNHLAKAILTQIENGQEIAGNRREAKAVFAVDVFKTQIVEPSGSDIRSGRVGVRGIALPPELAGGDEAAYFAYWLATPMPTSGSLPSSIADEIVNGPSKSSLDALLGAREWNPLLVPISNQRSSLDALVRTGRDSRFPNSNIGISMSSAEGLLATFQPPADLKSSVVTVLIVSQESPRGPISYDAVDFRWEPGPSASAPSFDLTRAGGATGPFDLTSSSSPSTTFQVIWPGAAGRTVRFLVYSGTMGTGSKQLRAEESGVVKVIGEDIALWSWDGRDFTGRQVPSGTYTIFASGTSPDEGELVDDLRLEVKSSPLGDASRVFRVSPGIVPSLVTLGIPQTVTAEVELTEALEWTVWAIARTDGQPWDPTVLEQLPAKTELTCPSNHVCAKVLRPEIASRSERIDWDFGATESPAFLEGIPVVDGRIPVELVLVAEDRDGIQHRLARSIQVETEANAISAEDLGLTEGILDVGALTPEGWAPKPSAGYKFKALAAGQLSYYPEREVKTTPRAEAKQVLRYFKDVPLALGYSKFYNSVELITSFSYTGAGIQKPVFRSRRHKTPKVEGIAEFNSYFAHGAEANKRGISVQPATDLAELDKQTLGAAQPTFEEVRDQLGPKWYGDPTQFYHVEQSNPDPTADYPTAEWKVVFPGEVGGPRTDVVYEGNNSLAKTFEHSCLELHTNLATNYVTVHDGRRCQLKYGQRVLREWVTRDATCGRGIQVADNLAISVPKIPGAQCDEEAHALSSTMEWSHRWDAREWWQDVQDGNLAIYFKKPGVEIEDSRGVLLWQAKLAGDGIHVDESNQTSIDNGPNRLLYPLGGFSTDRCNSPTLDAGSTVVCNNPGLHIFWKKRWQWGRSGSNQYNDLDANYENVHFDATPQYFYTNHPELNWSSDYLFQKDNAIGRTFNAHEMMLSGAHDASETDPVTGAFRIGDRTRAMVLEDFFDWEESNMADCMKRFQAKLEQDPEKAKIEHAVKAQDICATDRGGRKQGQRGFAYRLDYKGGSLPTGLKATDIVENFFRRDRADGFAAWVHDQTDEQNTDRVRFAPRLDISDRMRTVTWDTVWATFPFGIYESQFPNGLAIERADYRRTDAALRTVDGLVATTWKPELDKVAKSLRKGKWRTHNGAQSCPDDACYADLTGPQKTRALTALAKALDIPTDPLDLDQITESVKGVVAFDATQAFSPLFEHLQSRDNAVYESPTGKKYLFLVRESFEPQLELTTRIADQELPEADASPSVLAVLEADWSATPSITAYVAYLNRPTTLDDWDSRKSKEMEVTKGYFYGGGDFNATTFRSRDNAPALGDDQAADFFKAVNSSLYSFPSCAEDAEESLSPFCRRDDALEFSPTIQGNFEWKAEILEKDGRTPHAALSLVGAAPQQEKPFRNSFILDLATDATLRTFVTLKEPAGKTLPRTFTDDQGVEHAFQGYRIGHLDAKGIYKAIAVNPLLQVSPADDYLGDDIHHEKDFWNHKVGETSPAPVLAEWDVTGLNGPSKVVLQLLYADASGNQRVYHQVLDVRLGLTGFTDDPPVPSVEIQSAYRRASVTMPRGVMDENTMISIHPIALKDLPLPDDFPEVAPIGPVLQVQTTGQKIFDPALRPTLAVQFSARELWGRHAKPAPGESEVGKFEDATYAAIAALLAEVMPSYKIHLLSAEGRLDPQPTIAVLENCDEPTGSGPLEDCLLKLTAEVSHFSYALVLFDEAGEGIPTILSKRLRPGDGFEIRGLRDIDREPLPEVEWILSANGDFKEAKTGTWTTVSVHPGDELNKAGSFTIEVPEQVALDGTNVVFVRYKNASIAAKAVVVREPSTLRVTGWEIEGNGFTPLCGEPKVFATFTANRSGQVAWIVRDGRGLPVAQGDGVFVPTSGNRIGWDGCTPSGRAIDGTYSWEFLFPEAPSQNVVMDLHVGTPSVAVVRSIVASRPWLIPSTTDPDHGIRFHVTFEPVVAPVDPVLVLDGPAGAEVRLPLALQGDGRWTAFWTGKDEDLVAASGTWSARYAGTASGRAPRREVEIRAATRTIVANLSATPALLTPPGILQVGLTTAQKLTGALWIEGGPATSLPVTSLVGRRPDTDLPEIALEILPLEDQAGDPVARTWTIPVEGLVASGAKVVFHWNSSDGQAGIVTADFATEEPDWLKATDLSVLETVVHPQLKGRSAYSGKTGLSTLRIESPRAGEVRLTVACGGKTETSTKPVKAGTNSFTWPTETTPVADLTLPSTCSWSVEAFRVAEPEVAYTVGSISFQAQALGRAMVVPRVGQEPLDPWATAAAQSLISNGVEATVVAKDDAEVLDFMGAVPDGVLILLEDAPPSKIFDGTKLNSILRFVQGGGRVVFGGGVPFQQFRDGTSLSNAPVERVLELHGFLSWETNTLIQGPKVARPFLRTVGKNGFSWTALNGQTDLFTSRCGAATCASWGGVATELGVDLTRLPADVYTLPLSETSFAPLPDGKPDTDPKLSSSYFVQPIYPGFEASKTGSFVVLDPSAIASANVAVDAAMAAYRFYFSVDLGLSDAMVRSEPGTVPVGSSGPEDWFDPAPPGTVRPLRLVRGQTGSFTAQGILIGEIPRGQKASTVASIADPWNTIDPQTTFPVEFQALGTQPLVAVDATATHTFTVPQDAAFGEHVFGIDAAAATWSVPLADGTIRAETEKITVNNKASTKVVVVSTLDPVVVFDAGMGTVTTRTDGTRSLKATRGLAMKISDRAWKLKGKVTTEHVYGKVSLSLDLPTTLADDPKPKSHKVAGSIAAGTDIPFELEVALAGSSLPATLNELVGTLKVRDAFDNLVEIEVKITVDRENPEIKTLNPTIDGVVAALAGNVDPSKYVLEGKIDECPAPPVPDNPASPTEPGEDPLPDDEYATDVEPMYLLDAGPEAKADIASQATENLKLWQVRLDIQPEDQEKESGKILPQSFTFDEDDAAAAGFSSDRKEWNLLPAFLREFHTGIYRLEVEDFAGNITKESFRLVVDDAAPEVHVYHAKSTLVEEILGVADACDRKTNLKTYLTRAPLYAHPLPNREGTDPEDPGEPKYMEYWDAPNGTKSPMVVPTPKPFPLGTKDWEGVIETETSVERVPVVVNVNDLSPFTFKVTMAAAGDQSEVVLLDESKGWNSSSYSKYFGGEPDPGDPVYPQEVRDALTMNPNSIYFQVPMPTTTTRRRVEIEVTDAGGRTTKVELVVGEPLEELVTTDPAGDRSGDGADFGDVYLTREDAASGSWLHGMVHAWKADHAGKDRPDAFYVDLDEDPATGSDAVATVGGQPVRGFDVRVRFHRVSTRDDDSGTKVGYSQWQSGRWSEERLWTNLTSTAQIRAGANQHNEPWTTALGEGDQLLPTGKAALAPGGLLEFSVLIDQRTVAGQKVRVFLTGSADQAGEDAGGAKKFELPRARSITADGRSADWIRSRIPRASVAAFEGSSIAHNLSNSPVGTRQQRVELSLRNIGWKSPEVLVVRQFLTFSGCEGVQADEDLSHEGWTLVSEAPKPVNELQGYETVPEEVKYLEWRVQGSLLPAGSRIQGAPWVVLTAPATAACKDEMVQNSIRPLVGDVEVRDAQGTLLLGGDLPDPSRRRAPAPDFRCQGSCLQAQTATALSAVSIGPQWFKVVRTTPIQSLVATGNPGQVRVEGIGIFNDQASWPAPADGGNVHHVEVEPVTGSASWSILP